MNDQPPQYDPEAVQAYYGGLQAEIDGHLAALSRLLSDARPRIEEDLAVVRGLAAQVRSLLERVDYRVARYEQILAALDEALDPEADTHPVEGLRGKEIGQTAIQVLKQAGVHGAIHSREWFRLFEQAGHRAGGKDSYASFLTALTRHPDIVQVGNRSGLYRLQEDT